MRVMMLRLWGVLGSKWWEVRGRFMAYLREGRESHWGQLNDEVEVDADGIDITPFILVTDIQLQSLKP